jgi:hypothetical protein
MRHARSRWFGSTFADWSRAADPFAADPIPPVPPLTQNKGVVVEQPVNTVIAVIQWDWPGRARGRRRHVRGRRVLGRAQSAGFALSAKARRQRVCGSR